MPTNEPINTQPIQAFLSHVKSADASRAKEIKISIEEAKSLATTLGIVMANQQGRLEKLIIDSKSTEEVISIAMDGGNSWK